jgi:hypothetical protein
VLARLHSACFTGDVLGQPEMRLRPAVARALAQMGGRRGGVLLYLNQEGRGIGLANKMRAYSLQDQGFDTVEANHRLGFEDDERDFRIGAEIAEDGVFGGAALTNNPEARWRCWNPAGCRDRTGAAEGGRDRRERRLSGDQGREVGASAVTPADLVVTRTGLRFPGGCFPAPSGAAA